VATPDAAPAVALLAQSGEACQRMQEAITEAGGNLVLVTDPVGLDLARLQAARPVLALFVLEPAVEDAFEELEPLLDSAGIEVMLEEADVVNARKGWDLQRWKRHLTAKLQGHRNVLPEGGQDESPTPPPAAITQAAPAPPATSSASSFSAASSLPPVADTFDDLGGFDFSDAADTVDSFADLAAPSSSSSIESFADDFSVGTLDSGSTDSGFDDLSLSAFTDTSSSLQDDALSFSETAFADTASPSSAEEISFGFEESSSLSSGSLDDAFGGGLDAVSLPADETAVSATNDSLLAVDDFADMDFGTTDLGGADSGGAFGFDDDASSLTDSVALDSFADFGSSTADSSASSLDEFGDFSIGSDSDSSASGSVDDIFPSALDDSDTLNLDELLDVSASAGSGLDSLDTMSDFGSFDSLSGGDFGEEDELTSLLESGGHGGFGGGGGGLGVDDSMAVSVEELRALVSVVKDQAGISDKEKHNNLDNKQPQIGGPSGEFEKWALADPDDVSQFIQTQRGDAHLDEGKKLSAKELAGALNSLEARLEDMMDEPGELFIPFGDEPGYGGGGGGGNGGGNNIFGANSGSGGGYTETTPKRRVPGDLGLPGKGSGPVVILAGLSGVDGVRRVLGKLPPTFSSPVLICLKMDAMRYPRLAIQMSRATPLPVQLAEEGQPIQNATIYILPAQLGVVASGSQLHFERSDSVLAALPKPGNAVVVLSGADSAQVPEVLSFTQSGGWGGTQIKDGCFQPEAVEQLLEAGLPSAEPEALADLLIKRCAAGAS